MTDGASTIVIFIAWLITLITGKLPAPLHLAFTAVLRFQTRYYCYLGMLTPTYPWKLFGDEPDVSAPVTAAPAQTAPPTDRPRPRRRRVGLGHPARGLGSACLRGHARVRRHAWVRHRPGYEHHPGLRHSRPGYGTPAAPVDTARRPGTAAPQPASPPANWRLVLPQSAKNLLILFIVLGVITDVGGQVARARPHESDRPTRSTRRPLRSASGTAPTPRSTPR